MGERAGQLIRAEDGDNRIATEDAEIQHTREEMSETLDAIQEKLAPERLTGDAKDAAMETVDHVIAEAKVTAQEVSEVARAAAMEAVDHALEKVKELFPDLAQQAEDRARQAVDHALAETKETAQGLSEIASVAAMEAVDHALERVKETFPDLTHQAQDAAREAVDHAIEEAKTAVRELGVQARAAVRDATIGRVERMATTTSQTSRSVGSTMVQTVKQNPGPAALTALGLSWLVMNGRSSAAQDKTTQISGSLDYASSGAQGKSTASQVKETVGGTAGDVQETLTGAVDQAEKTASEIAGKVQETVTGAAGQVQEAATGTAGQVKETTSKLSGQVKQLPTRLRQSVGANPVPLGLVAVALGSAAAFAIPETRRENELLGEARDTLMKKAETAAQTTIEKVQGVTEAVGETVEKEAKYAGLTGDSK